MTTDITTYRLVAWLPVLAIVMACSTRQQGEYRPVTYQEDQITIKGNMNADSQFDGQVFYYSGPVLTSVRTFDHGREEGRFATLHPNGKPKEVGYKLNGRWDGILRVFNEDGSEFARNHYFHGRLMGPQIGFDATGKPKSFIFLNFEGERLLDIDYTVDSNRITGRFCYASFRTMTAPGTRQTEVFHYGIDPPGYRVTYATGSWNSQTRKFLPLDSTGAALMYYEHKYPEQILPFAVRAEIYDSVRRKSYVEYVIDQEEPE
jgi:hypothetical protein